MKVKMLKKYVVNGKPESKGAVVDLPDSLAAALIENKAAKIETTTKRVKE